MTDAQTIFAILIITNIMINIGFYICKLFWTSWKKTGKHALSSLIITLLLIVNGARVSISAIDLIIEIIRGGIS